MSNVSKLSDIQKGKHIFVYNLYVISNNDAIEFLIVDLPLHTQFHTLRIAKIR